jgi:hypothetical protein
MGPPDRPRSAEIPETYDRVEMARLSGFVSARLGRSGLCPNFDSACGGSTPPGAIAWNAVKSRLLLRCSVLVTAWGQHTGQHDVGARPPVTVSAARYLRLVATGLSVGAMARADGLASKAPHTAGGWGLGKGPRAPGTFTASPGQPESRANSHDPSTGRLYDSGSLGCRRSKGITCVPCA